MTQGWLERSIRIEWQSALPREGAGLVKSIAEQLLSIMNASIKTYDPRGYDEIKEMRDSVVEYAAQAKEALDFVIAAMQDIDLSDLYGDDPAEADEE